MGKAKKDDILKGDTKIQEACEELRAHVNNINPGVLSLVGGVYVSKNKGQIYAVKIDGIEIGYRRECHKTFINRQIFVKVPGYKISDISKDQRARIMSAVFNVFLQPGANIPTIDMISPDCLLMQQQSIPMVPVELSPGLVSIAGGMA